MTELVAALYIAGADDLRPRSRLPTRNGVTEDNADTAKAPTQAADTASADEVVYHHGYLAIRDTSAGTFTTRVRHAGVRTTKIGRVPAAVQPGTWNLDVTSWEHGSGGPNDTAKKPMPTIPLTTLPTGKLPDWLSIPGLENKSGIGVYTSTLDVGPAWTGGTGAYLDLGDVHGLARVIVNGRRLPTVNQLDPSKIDLGGYLQPGKNIITVRLSTLLGNAAYPTSPFGEKSYGLLGPVVLTPYGQRTVR